MVLVSSSARGSRVESNIVFICPGTQRLGVAGLYGGVQSERVQVVRTGEPGEPGLTLDARSHVTTKPELRALMKRSNSSKAMFGACTPRIYARIGSLLATGY
jgi:hypothetical protein